MKTAGIVAEYNPFHTGHAHQIARTRALLGGETAIVCVMSGNWVQQADCAIADKWTRARLALLGGADLVLELPTPWATASAETFARGAVELLGATGVVDALSFGSECGDIAALERAAVCLDTEEYRSALKPLLDRGEPFAVCRQQAVEQLLGTETGELLRRPNNNLGIEYLRALRALGSSITPLTVLREGAGHGERAAMLSSSATEEERRAAFRASNPFLSATSIRHSLLEEGEWDLMAHYLPPGGVEVLQGGTISLPALASAQTSFLVRLRTMTEADWAALPDSGAAEGLPARLVRAGRQARSVEEFLELAKTKRYTHARLRRLVLWAWLGLTAADLPAHPPYLRVLGANGTGQSLLRTMKKRASLPILTKPAHVRNLGETCRRLFALECRCTDLYGLLLPSPIPGGLEWTSSPVLLL